MKQIPSENTTELDSWASDTTSANAIPKADSIPAYLKKKNRDMKTLNYSLKKLQRNMFN